MSKPRHDRPIVVAGDGRVAIPAAVRAQAGLSPGDVVLVDWNGSFVRVVPARVVPRVNAPAPPPAPQKVALG